MGFRQGLTPSFLVYTKSESPSHKLLELQLLNYLSLNFAASLDRFAGSLHGRSLRAEQCHEPEPGSLVRTGPALFLKAGTIAFRGGKAREGGNRHR